jgi:hypothetical protein
MPELPNFDAGRPVRAPELQAVRDRAAIARHVVGGRGVSVQESGATVVVSVGGGWGGAGVGEWQVGVIGAVQGADGDWVQDVKYKAGVVGAYSQTETEWVAPLGRLLSAGLRLERVARVNEPCMILRRPIGEGRSEALVWLPMGLEVPRTIVCSEPGVGLGLMGMSVFGDGRGFVAPPPPPPPPAPGGPDTAPPPPAGE